MDVQTLLGFLGHSSIHPPLDDFLARHGVKKRPKGDDPIQSIELADSGISLEFEPGETFDEVSLTPRRSKGRFILTSIYVDTRFKSALPYGVSLDASTADLRAKLGAAKEDDPVGPSLTFYVDNILIVINWRKKKPKESFIRLAVPTVYDKENLKL